MTHEYAATSTDHVRNAGNARAAGRRRAIARLVARGLALASAALALPGCVIIVEDDSRASATVLRSASFAEVSSVEVDGDNGGIRFERDPAVTGIAIAADLRCDGADQAEADARAAEARVVAERDASGRVSVRAVFPPRRDSRGWSSDRASFVIRAASLERIVASTSNGRIDIEGLGAVIEARTSNGAIDIEGVSGSVDARTSNGRIEVTLAEGAAGNVSLATSNGAVELDLPASWQGSVRATTSNGRIELPGVESREGSAETAIGDAAKAKTIISTSNGRVAVRRAGN